MSWRESSLDGHASGVERDVQLIAIRTDSGFGSAVGGVIEDAMGDRIVGTISGQRVVLVVVQGNENAEEIHKDLLSYIEKIHKIE